MACKWRGIKLPQRIVIISLICLTLFVTHTQKLIFDFALDEFGMAVAKNNTSKCKPKNETKRVKPNTGVWTKDEQGNVRDLFFLGYIAMQFPGGYSGDRFGARYVFTFSLLMSSIITTCLVFIVDYAEYWTVVAARLVFGLSQASLYPNVATLISRWILPKNRSKAAGCAYSFIGLGYFFGRKSGFVYGYLQNWRMLFYVFGGVGLGCYVLCIVLVFSDPSRHPFITAQEKQLLMEGIEQEDDVRLWMLCPGMVLDVAAMASVVLVEVAHGFVFFFAVTNLPQYYEEVLHARMDYLDDFEWLLIPAGLGGGILADKLIHEKKYESVKVRKAYVAIGSLIPGLFLVSTPYMGCSRLAVCIFRMCALPALGFYYSGFKPYVLDVTRNFSGTLMALIGAVRSVMDLLCLKIVDNMAPNGAFEEWKVLTWIPFFFAVASSLIFIVLADGKRRNWDVTRR